MMNSTTAPTTTTRNSFVTASCRRFKNAKPFHLISMMLIVIIEIISHFEMTSGQDEINQFQFQHQHHFPEEGKSFGKTESQIPSAIEDMNVDLDQMPLIFPMQPMAEGPGIDLVAFNRRRFELEHHHDSGYQPTTATTSSNGNRNNNNNNLDHELRRGQSIESDLVALSNKLILAVPNDLSKQFLESVNMDPSMLEEINTAISGGSLLQQPLQTNNDDDPDGASIARLTKSCLTVHASSARPDQLDVKFYLYTKKNPTKAHLLTPQMSRQELLMGSPFNPNKPIKWITHGFHTNVDKSEWMLEAKDKILSFEDANVILTDWRRGASPALAFYPKAAANAHVVAKFIVRILRRLRDDIDFSQVHLIGHSLGAHIMGFVGSAFTEEHLMRQQQLLSFQSAGQGNKQTLPFWRNQKEEQQQQKETTNKLMLIGRITACDPALPCFGPSSSGPVRENIKLGPVAIYRDTSEQQSNHRQQKSLGSATAQQQQATNNSREFIGDGPDWTPSMWTHLRPDSAIIVEVMHSNPGVMGYADPLGDFDFYPNGFDRQPGCGQQSPESSSSSAATPIPGAPDNLIPSQQPPFKRMKRQWSSVLDGFMSTVVHPLVASPSHSTDNDVRNNRQTILSNPHFQSLSKAAASSALRESSKFTQTIDRFLNPIRSFFKGNTCSHHRSVEYMVESLYYDSIPQDRRLDRDLVCQMVGYRCQDYASFKRGFCFRCTESELDCRAFGMSTSSFQISGDESITRAVNRLALHQFGPSISSSTSISSTKGRQLDLLTKLEKEKFSITNQKQPELPSTMSNAAQDQLSIMIANETTPSTINIDSNYNNNRSPSNDHYEMLKNTTRRIVKRVLPTFNHHEHNYAPQTKNKYFFDTKSNKSFCLHHYHIHVKYRWFRVRDNIMLDGFRLLGTLANLSRKTPIQLHKFTHNSFTALLSEPIFFGQIESLILFGAKVKPTLIDYIEITFMSNLDPKIRALGSAKLCHAPPPIGINHNRNHFRSSAHHQVTNDKIADHIADGLDLDPAESLFVRCSGSMVR